MKTATMIGRVMAMEDSNNGVLLFHTDEGMLCFHSDTKHKTMYRYEAFCQDKYVKERIFVNPELANHEEISSAVIAALKTICGEFYHEVINPLDGIVCVHNEEDFQHYIWEVETYNTSDSKFAGETLTMAPVRCIQEHNMLVINLVACDTNDAQMLSEALRPALLTLTECSNYILTEEERDRIKGRLT